MENNEKALDALRKIENVIDEVKDMFPSIEKGQVKIATKKYSDPLRTLKKVSGIIVNYDESNAERKLDSLLKFLGIIPYKEK
jgi:phage-related protein